MRTYQVSYKSPTSRNEFIEVLASEVTKNIVNEVKNSGMFSVMADITLNNSHKDQLSLVVRHVDGEGQTKERLLKPLRPKIKLDLE